MFHPRSNHRPRRRLAALTALFAALAPALLIAPADARALAAVDSPCTVNGKIAPLESETIVRGTDGNDFIVCPGLTDIDIVAGKGNDTITVNGNYVEAQGDVGISGQDGDDIITVTGDVTGGAFIAGDLGAPGADQITVGSVIGRFEATVIGGGPGNDTITTGRVMGLGRFKSLFAWYQQPADEDDSPVVKVGGTVLGEEGSDTIRVGRIYDNGAVDGGPDSDDIEAKSLGNPVGGIIKGGPHDDRISGPDGSPLPVGPGNEYDNTGGVVNGGSGTNTCHINYLGKSTIKLCQNT